MTSKELDKKRQKKRQENEIYKVVENPNKSKFYVLDMFPYPSGSALHVGHPKGYIATDGLARKKMLEGFSVLHPMGFDTFGLGTEQYAIENKMKPQIVSEQNIEKFVNQLQSFGCTYDRDRCVSTADPDYFKWTQWVFLKLYEHYYDEKEGKAKPITELVENLKSSGLGDEEIEKQINNQRLAYIDYKPINRCPKCKTGLANEDLDDGKCERCGSEVEQKPMKQRVLRITKYAERLLTGLDKLDRDESMKELERNWIGKSEGTEFTMLVKIPENKPDNYGEGNLSKDNNDGSYDIIGLAMKVHREIGPGLQEKLYKNALKKLLEKNGFKVEEEKKIEYKIDGEKIGYGSIDLLVNDTIAIELKSRKVLEGDFYKQLRTYIQQSDSIKTGLLINFYNGKLEYKRLEKDYKKTAPILGDSQNNSQLLFNVYTTRVDTVFGMSFVVMAPEHPLVEKITTPEQKDAVEKYKEQAKYKTQLERTELQKEKTGQFTGSYAINPFNGEEVPIYIGDYVLANYGTGVVMAVPAHDERDFEFAKKYGIKITQSILPREIDWEKQEKVLSIAQEISDLAESNGIKVYFLGGLAIPFLNGVLYREHNDIDCLIEKNDIDKYIELLGKNGFEEIGTLTKTWDLHCFRKNGIEIEVGIEQSDRIKELSIDGKSKDDNKKYLLGYSGYTLTKEYLLKFKKYLSTVRQDKKDLLDIVMIQQGAYTDKGILVNSGEFTGLTSDEAIKKMQEWLTEKGIGGKKLNYKIQDRVFSRQRYRGEPFPVVFCDKCGILPMKESDLPLLLPDVENYEPTGTEEGPLADVEEWINVDCPICGGKAKRESNTMPGWAGSSWYRMRYMDNKNDKELVSKERDEYRKNVDVYVGGAEHVTRHMIYARFWQKFLFDIGVVSQDEPFLEYHSVGLIMGEDGRKMSKRRGNVVNPDDIINEHGADTLRTYEMFMGPFDQSIAWSTNGISGVKKFLEKIVKLFDKIENGYQDANDTEILLNQSIKKLTEDIDGFRFNTAVSQLMILVNHLTEKEKISKETYEKLVILVAPFAPHMAEEMREKLGNEFSIFTKGAWPKYDENKLVSDQVNLAVQINGKMRGTIETSREASETEVMEKIKSDERLANYITGEIKKVIYVKGKIMNIIL